VVGAVGPPGVGAPPARVLGGRAATTNAPAGALGCRGPGRNALAVGRGGEDIGRTRAGLRQPRGKRPQRQPVERLLAGPGWGFRGFAGPRVDSGDKKDKPGPSVPGPLDGRIARGRVCLRSKGCRPRTSPPQADAARVPAGRRGRAVGGLRVKPLRPGKSRRRRSRARRPGPGRGLAAQKDSSRGRPPPCPNFRLSPVHSPKGKRRCRREDPARELLKNRIRILFWDFGGC
jgi:hypothetical protein